MLRKITTEDDALLRLDRIALRSIVERGEEASFGARRMRSVAELRAEARRFRETIENVTDPALKQELAARALDLSIRAEGSHEAPEILRTNISRYRSMLAAGIDDDQKNRIVQEMLTGAEEMLAQLMGQP